jgi:hypothetical protein
MFFGNLFRGMEDAIVSLLKTGKLNFKALADSIISDMIRIYVQKQIMGPLIEGLMGDSKSGGGGLIGSIGGLLGFKGSSGGTMVAEVSEQAWGTEDFAGAAVGGSFASGTDFVPRDMLAMVHRGEAIVPAMENRKSDGPQQTFVVDMRGASVEAVQRLEAFVMRMNSTIEKRAVDAVFEQNLRGNRV